MNLVTWGSGIPQTPFVTRGIGRAIQEAFPAKSGVNRLLLYKVQEEALKRFDKSAEKEAEPVVAAKQAPRAERRAQRVVHQEPVPKVSFAEMDQRLAYVASRLTMVTSSLAPALKDMLISFSMLCFSGFSEALPPTSIKDDEETALLLCL